VRHVQVGDYDRDRVVGRNDQQRLFGIVAAADIEAGTHECPFEDRQCREIVIEEKDCLFHSADSSR
jgi:hypothetical protein